MLPSVHPVLTTPVLLYTSSFGAAQRPTTLNVISTNTDFYVAKTSTDCTSTTGLLVKANTLFKFSLVNGESLWVVSASSSDVRFIIEGQP